jgi:thiol-disulfide isomerase/thioredoxin
MSLRLFVVLLSLSVCGTIVADEKNPPADAAAAQPVSQKAALTDDQIARGRAIREVLIRGIDFAREHGDWPKELSELKIENAPAVTYLGPPAKLNGLERHLRGQLKSVSPVCHESLGQHPDGVWVGYADGHIELVYDAAALQAALSQFEQARPLIEKLAKPAEATKKQPLKADARLILKLVDESGQPIAGAQVGGFLWNADYDSPQGRGQLMTLIGDKVKPQEATSDDAGRIEAQYQWFFDPDDASDGPASLIAYHKERGLIAVTSIEPEAFSKPEAAVPTIEVKLHHGVPVSGSLSRIGAPPAAGEPLWTNAYIYMLSGERLRPMSSMSKHQAFEFLLPPGDYLLDAYGDDTYNAHRFLRITDSMTSGSLHLDLPAALLATLAGKQAPELREIKAWKNGGPVTLEQLRGKWIVLDFWGYWCGPFVGSMPELMKLHDDFHDRGLVVIAVHDDSVTSIEEMDKNLQETKKDVWKGRDLPFLVALDGGGELPIAGTERSVKGATHAAYGIQSWPTTVLINPQGMVVGKRFDPRDPELRPCWKRNCSQPNNSEIN